MPEMPEAHPSRTSRWLLWLGIAGAMLIIAIASTAIVLNGRMSSSQVASVTTPSATPSATATSRATRIPPTATPRGATPEPHATPGWASAGPSFALSIAFAPNDVQTAYVCGPNPGATPASVAELPRSSNPQVPLAVGVSYDGGATWQSYDTPAVNSQCTLSISPTNPLDVALIGDDNISGCAPCGGSDVFISTDGGKNWHQQRLPLETALQPTTPSVDQVAWVGDILFATPHQALGLSYPHALAASANGGPFQWTNQNALPASAGKTASIGELFSQGTALFALVDAGNCPSVCYVLTRSTDGGATWQIPQGDFSTYIQAWAGMDGTTLYALAGRLDSPYDTIDISQDVGNSWHSLPKLPGNLGPGQNVFALADGTVYCAVNGLPATSGFPATQSGIYRLTPGGRAWKYVATLPGANTLLAVQAGGNGNALALWGQGAFDAVNGIIGAGLQRHTP